MTGHGGPCLLVFFFSLSLSLPLFTLALCSRSIMEFYSFQYPPRPIPSDAHRPSRYFFHNLDQDQVVQKALLGFQKDGAPPRVTTTLKGVSSTDAITEQTAPPASLTQMGMPTTPFSPAFISVDTSGLEVLKP
ncbi:MAG: hypothetical protein J3Q66DRAFT_410341 [Benniella sp.]|nr:MAG: hypothetical protein J3Q66DRAFT_410341 [Benniella sp.]